MTLFATERVPQPILITGVVEKDLTTRSLSVRRSELASGYEKLNWRTAHQALVQAQETGWRSGGTVWASAPGAFQVAHVLPGPYLSLEVHFPSGVQAFSELVGKPGLFAWVGVDRSTGRFINVKFSKPAVTKCFSALVVRVSNSGHLVLMSDGERLYSWRV